MKHFLRTLTLAGAALLALASLSSCDSGNDDYWWGDDGSNAYYDSNLLGTWQLIQINGQAVSPLQTNYMEFQSGGRGYYFYYSAGLQATQRLIWVCQAGYYRDTITVRYQDGSQSSMNYYFTEGRNYLYLNWTTYNGAQYTYCYRYMGGYLPW